MYIVEYLARNIFGRVTSNKEILPENEATKLAKMVAKKEQETKKKDAYLIFFGPAERSDNL